MKSIIPFILALIILISNPVWFLWDIRFHVVFFLVFFLILLLLPRFNQSLKHKEILNKLFIFSIFIIYFIIIVTLVDAFQTYLLLSSFILLVYFFISESEKRKALDILTSILSYILFFSFVTWLIHNYIFKLPMFNIISYYESKGVDKVLENYILFIQPSHDFIVRFYSIFDEPGTLGTLTAFILYGNKYNFKDKRNIILLIASIFTFSMAFYLLFIIGFLFQKIKNFKKIILYFFILFSFTIITFLILKDNQTFQVTVIDRFLNFNNSFENRESHYLDSYFKYFLRNDNFLFGKGRNFIVNNPIIFEGQTYKFFIIEFGFIGMFVVLITYISMIKVGDFLSVGCFFIFFISFIQRPFLIQPWQILLFIIVLSQLNNINLDKKVNGR